MPDLFGVAPPLPHKAAVREKLLSLLPGSAFTCEDTYRLCRGLPNRPVNWQANIRDELYRLRDQGYFSDGKDGDIVVYTRTGKQGT